MFANPFPDEAEMTKIEQLLNEILCELTGESATFPVDQSFSEQGVDSFLALRLMRGIEDRTGLALELHALFDFPTIAQLARHIDACIDARINAEAHTPPPGAADLIAA